jgi:DNA repair protein RecO (recombination protein O)
MPFFKSQAIVLQVTDYAEWDKMVSLYSEHYGRFKGIAKGAKRSLRRFGSALEPFTHNEISFFEREGQGLARLEHCRIINAFPEIGQDYKKIAYGNYLLELVHILTPERERNTEIFRLLLFFLKLLNKEPCREDLLRIFELRLTSLLGYQPQFLQCISCGQKFSSQENYKFSIQRGGILCSKCHQQNNAFPTLSHGTIKIFQQIQHLNLLKLNRIYLSSHTLGEGKEILSKFLEYHLGKKPKSLEVIDQMTH